MKQQLVLHPVKMTPAVMQDLEHRGLIIRLCPGHHELPAQPGEALWEPIYDSSPAFGPHHLITVSVNRTTFSEFGTHLDNEEFLLLGEETMKPLYLVISLHGKDGLTQRIRERKLQADDFVCLRVTWNDPQVSFFTMLAGVPHGETVAESEGRPASFYVTEPRDLATELTDFGDYALTVQDRR